MEFVVLGKFRKKPTKETPVEANKAMEKMKKDGVKFVKMYWTLGRYDIVGILEGPDEKTVLRSLLRLSDILSTETLVAVPRDEAIKLIE